MGAGLDRGGRAARTSIEGLCITRAGRCFSSWILSNPNTNPNPNKKILVNMTLTISAALSLERCSRRTSDSQGAEGVLRAGLEDKGQTVSKQDVRLEQKVSVALLASRDVNSLE